MPNISIDDHPVVAPTVNMRASEIVVLAGADPEQYDLLMVTPYLQMLKREALVRLVDDMSFLTIVIPAKLKVA